MLSPPFLPLKKEKDMYYEFTVNDRTYKLKLRTRDIVDVEKKLGKTLLMLFGEKYNQIPSLEVCSLLIHASMQKYEHGIRYENVLDILDEYLEEHSYPELMNVLIGIYEASGLIPKSDEEKELEAEAKN